MAGYDLLHVTMTPLEGGGVASPHSATEAPEALQSITTKIE